MNKNHQTPHKPSVLRAPANGAEKVSMSRIKEMVLGGFWGPGGPKLVCEAHFHNFWKLAGRLSVIFCKYVYIIPFPLSQIP